MRERGDRWAEVDRIFSEALELPSGEREAFLRQACGGDGSLLREVAGLLDDAEDREFLPDPSDESSGALLAALPGGTKAPPPLDPLMGETLGPFRVVKRIGEGGMGNVYLAERTEEFQQQVAIKTLRRGIDTEDVVRRFLAERQILARLDHPNIGHLLDGGSTPDGRPYFVMEFVRGEKITSYADREKLSLRDRIVLLETVASALQHAHQHLVVHRDLKPSNVFVTHDGVVKLLDFGIARLIGSEHQWGRTSTGLRILTPAFAAPEQVQREPTTTATDVYQLGALSYELLGGVRPFPADLSPAELERRIVDTDPAPVSQALARAEADVPENRGCPTAAELARALSGDLDTILAKALAKKPEHRYASVEAMAVDFARHRTGRPIGARPATLRYRFGRFTHRNPWFLPAAATAVLALGVYVGTTVRHNRELTQERNVAQSEAARAEAVTAFVTDLLERPNPWTGGEGADLTVLEALGEGLDRIEVEFAAQPRLRAQLYQTLGSSYRGLERLETAEALQRRAVGIWDETEGPASPNTIRARSALGQTLSSTLGPDSANAVLEPLLGHLREPTTDEVRLLRADVLEALGGVQWDVSDFDSTFTFFGRAAEELAHLDVPRPEREAALLREHSRALGIADRRAEAVTLSTRAVALLESALPPDHVDLAAARWDLGSALSSPGGGREEEGLEQFDLALGVFVDRLEPEDPNLLDLRYDRAYALLTMGRLEEAEEAYRELLPLYDSTRRTARRYSFADVAQNLAATLKRQGRMDEAISFSMVAHEYYERELGTHYLTAYPLLTVAEVELARGRFAAGRDLAAEAYEILSETLPEGHASAWVARCRRGRGRFALGDRQAGLEDLVLSSAALDGSTYGPEHPYPTECRQSLADAKAALGTR